MREKGKFPYGFVSGASDVDLLPSFGSPELLYVSAPMNLLIDGQNVSPGKVMLSTGPHTLDVAKEGYGPEQLRIVVYPDVRPKVKIKLRKLKS